MKTLGIPLLMLAAGLMLSAVPPVSAQEDPRAIVAPAAAPNSWVATTTAGAPAGRFIHTAIWTGSKMIVWGGGAETFDSFADGRIYDPATNKWTVVSSFNAPSGREAASAVWTGSRMIVWGGEQFKGSLEANKVLADGGVYDPETDTWTKTSTSGAPSPRGGHSAVWTGSEMIVWGGSSKAVAPEGVGFGDLNTGAIYEPVSNTWRPISKVGAPSPRDRHTALWTGSRMIIWGGDDGNSNDLASGGIYDPVTDSWVATSTAGAPSGRDDHAGVWTGSKMIIWGGYAGNQRTNTGGVFDPVANSWTATSTTGAPSARELVHAIAFRGRLIVFGGWDGHADVNTGGIYDPETNTWTPTSTAGAPSGREQGSAVFTGSKMIVWGGFAGQHPTNSGGVYAPPAFPCPGTRGCVVAVPAPDEVRVHPRP
jgi:N-acetylneuraminic acid mutarotase